MKNVTKIIMLALTVLLEVIVISIVLTAIFSWQNSASKAIDDFTDIVTGVGTEVETLDGKTLTGMELKELTTKYYDQLVILITTQDYPKGFYDVSTIDDNNSVYYIANNTKMTCKVIRNTNEAVIGLMFTQVGVLEAEFDRNFAEGKQGVNALDQSIALLQYEMRYDLSTRNSLAYQLARNHLESGVADYKDVNSIESVIDALQKTIQSKQVEKLKLEEQLGALYEKLEELGGK